MKVFDKIPTMEEDALMNLFHNALKIISENSTMKPNAEKCIALIEKEWERRIELAKQGNYKHTRPQVGMLSHFGYKVGEHEGIKKKNRRVLLDYIFTSKLPMVHSPSYLLEWGDPNTEERLKKMSQSLAYFAKQKRRLDEDKFEKAIMDWEDDLDYLKEKYYDENNFGFTWPDTMSY
jgi:hypothetical protein